ncbi:MAG TPA: hypothetical protein VFW40_13555 [Capsulimonadaceae bacterium]|nr:hypothetical protein [Capsulimonadaceae bacterium]
MTRTRMWTVIALIAVFAVTALLPTVAFASASSRQKNKNTWRNLAIGSGVVAGYGLLHHNSTATVLGAAGAAYSLNRYEQDRKSQSAHDRARARYWHRRYPHRYR